jgi:hypothetical protein
MAKYNFSGYNTSDPDALRAVLTTEIVYNLADTMFVGGLLMPTTSTPNLTYKFSTPTINQFEMEEIAEGGKADLSDFQWYNKFMELKKNQVRYIIDDEVKAIEQGNEQEMLNAQYSAQALAYKKDRQIMTAVTGNAFNTVAADMVWNAKASQPQDDILNAIALIVNNTTITDSDLKNMVLLYPAAVFGQLSKPIQIGEIQQSVEDWIGAKGIKIAFTRALTTAAILGINTPRMGRHIVHDGSKIPGAESWREIGVGQGNLITQYFNTGIIPYANGQTTSKYLCTITGVST